MEHSNVSYNGQISQMDKKQSFLIDKKFKTYSLLRLFNKIPLHQWISQKIILIVKKKNIVTTYLSEKVLIVGLSIRS